MNDDDEHLLAAIELAWQARKHGNHPFGALLVDADGNVILRAENTVVTGRDCTGHAETNLMRIASERFSAEFLQGCPLYTNDDFPLSVKQMGEILAKYPNLTAFVPTGGFPQFVPNAYKQVVEKNMDRIKSGKTILVVADTLPVQMELMKEGLSKGQVGQRPFEMGYKTMMFFKDMKDGKANPTDPTYTGLDVCTPETADSCIGK